MNDAMSGLPARRPEAPGTVPEAAPEANPTAEGDAAERRAEEEPAGAVGGYEPAAPAPLGVPRTATGHPRVDGLLERLGDVDHLPADGHLDVYEDVHRGLRDTLTALDAPHPQPGTPYDDRS
ncbi:hypothetical protein ACFPM3_10080 [Streptomyces coeruleoprunus]|uniref:Uncharacterized protein n=1 Tax=Streptomyces coeruleoprunus TaxID=285563 RepID=A0ABV9XBE2_9ACTN